VARGTQAVIAVADRKRPPRHEIPLYEDHGGQGLAFTDFLQIVGNVLLVRRQQGQLACTQDIFRNMVSPWGATRFSHEASRQCVAELKG
jgi:hypothetical protein